MKPKYYVETYDLEKEEYTAQRGVRKGPYALFGLRKAILKLRELGYEGGRDDPSILITRKPALIIDGNKVIDPCKTAANA